MIKAKVLSEFINRIHMDKDKQKEFNSNMERFENPHKVSKKLAPKVIESDWKVLRSKRR